MLPSEIAWEMFIDKNSPERKEAEKMFGKRFDDMTPEQRVVAAETLAATEFYWRKNYDGQTALRKP